jgi:hypothetical protein
MNGHHMGPMTFQGSEQPDFTPMDRAAWAVAETMGPPAALARAALTGALEDREGLVRNIAEAIPCTWSLPQVGHPYNDSCRHKRDRIDGAEPHGACWDLPYELASVVALWLTGDAS